MNNYTTPYKITSKILKLSTQISEEFTKLQFIGVEKVNPMLRKKNRIKTLAGTLEIEGKYKMTKTLKSQNDIFFNANKFFCYDR